MGTAWGAFYLLFIYRLLPFTKLVVCKKQVMQTSSFTETSSSQHICQGHSCQGHRCQDHSCQGHSHCRLVRQDNARPLSSPCSHAAEIDYASTNLQWCRTTVVPWCIFNNLRVISPSGQLIKGKCASVYTLLYKYRGYT